MTTAYFRGKLILDFLKNRYKKLKNKKVYINSLKYKTFSDVIFQKATYNYNENVDYVISVEKDKNIYKKKVIDLSSYFELLNLDFLKAREIFKNFKPINILELEIISNIFKKLIKKDIKILYVNPKRGEYNLILLILIKLHKKSTLFIDGEIDSNYQQYINKVFSKEIKESDSYDIIISEKKLKLKEYNEFFFYLYFYLKKKNGDCPICGSKSEFIFMKKNNHKWYKCKMCKHQFVKNVDEVKLESFYENYAENRDEIKPFLKERINEISFFLDLDNINDILEIGAGNGEMLIEFKKQNKNVVAIEIDKNAIKFLNNQKIEVYDDLLKINKQFDLIYSYHTLEHIKDISKIYSLMYTLLKSNGVLIIHIPYNEIDYGIEDHLHIFSLESITMLHKKIFGNYKYLTRSIISSAGVYTPVITIASKKMLPE